MCLLTLEGAVFVMPRRAKDSACLLVLLACFFIWIQMVRMQQEHTTSDHAADNNTTSVGVEQKQPLAPAFFIYGDSTVDSGNNNYLQTLAKANLPPYGRDFDTHQPTGRFSNGRLSVDFLASFMHLPFPQPYMSGLNLSTMRSGANFASAGAGILSESGGDLGQHIPLVAQIQQFSDFKDALRAVSGEEETRLFIAKSIHYISIGSNDFIHYYLRNVSGVESYVTALDFNDLLIGTLLSQIQRLYDIGARKVMVVGIGPLGCAPYFLFLDNSNTGHCIDDVNFMIEEYNDALRADIEHMYETHIDMDITFCDIYDGLNAIVQAPTNYGFQTSTVACCGLGRYGGWLMCIISELACSNASTHVWWDEFHPTHHANHLLADSIWSGKHFPTCPDMTMKQLISSSRYRTQIPAATAKAPATVPRAADASCVAATDTVSIPVNKSL